MKEYFSKELKDDCRMLFITQKQRPSLSELQRMLVAKHNVKVSLQGLSNWIREGNWGLEREGIAHEAVNRVKEELIQRKVDDSIRKIKTLDAIESKLYEDLIDRAKGKSLEGLAQAIVAIRKQRLLETGQSTERTESVFSKETPDDEINKYIKDNEAWLSGFLKVLDKGIQNGNA